MDLGIDQILVGRFGVFCYLVTEPATREAMLVDPAAEPGSRVVEVSVRDGEGWAPIDPAATYTVASNNFMRKGGDGYAMFSEQGENAYDFGPNLEDVVSDYLAANPGYVPFIDGRITTVQ